MEHNITANVIDAGKVLPHDIASIKVVTEDTEDVEYFHLLDINSETMVYEILRPVLDLPHKEIIEMFKSVDSSRDFADKIERIVIKNIKAT